MCIRDSSVCLRNLNRNQRPQGVFHCILSEVAYVSVQPGDILGLELPPTDDADFETYFTNGSQMSYVFQQQLNSIVNLSEAHSVTKDIPQISLQVVLGNLPPTPPARIPNSQGMHFAAFIHTCIVYTHVHALHH